MTSEPLSRMRAAHYPVVVVGAGPAGLTLANLLGQCGVRCLLIERNLTTVQEPRAVSIDDESLRTMQAAGVIEAVLRDVVPGYGSVYYTARRKCFAKVEPSGMPYGYPRRNAFRQPVLEARLCTALQALPTVETWFGWELTQFAQDSKVVQLSLRNPQSESRTISCDYLVGCDGATSTVRSGLGIELEGMTYGMRWLIVDLENSNNLTKHTEVFCDRRRPCITLPGPDRTRRYEFELLPGEEETEMLAQERVQQLLAEHGADPGANICRKAIYRFHARVASQWSVGRILLAGDAAHLTPPFAGQGMNSGLRDAHNLAWKLAAVTSGLCGPSLLETYERERRGHVSAMIRLAVAMGLVMSPKTRFSEVMTQGILQLLRWWPAVREHITQMKYKPKPQFFDGFLIADGRSAPDTLVGKLLPQPMVTGRDGRRALLDDFIGPRFALVVRTQDPGRAFALLAHKTWSALGVVLVAIVPADSQPVASNAGVVVSEQDQELETALGRDRSKVLFLRPDKYVAATFSLVEAEKAATAVEALMMQTWDDRPVPS